MKTIFITGANGGLGLELSRVFLKNGWRVIAACRTANSLPEDVAKNSNTTAVTLDFTDQKSLDAALASVGKTPIDVLINNAGIYDSPSVDDDVVISKIADIETVFEINTIGPKVLAEALLENLSLGGEKLVVTISSGMGTYAQLHGLDLDATSRGSSPAYVAEHWIYSASKTAVNFSMLCFGITHPDIKSVLVNPGWMKTKIGGNGAPLTPTFSAESIFGLVSDHKNKLPNGKMTDYDGKPMDL